jgi:hypothetical protein
MGHQKASDLLSVYVFLAGLWLPSVRLSTSGLNSSDRHIDAPVPYARRGDLVTSLVAPKCSFWAHAPVVRPDAG